MLCLFALVARLPMESKHRARNVHRFIVTTIVFPWWMWALANSVGSPRQQGWQRSVTTLSTCARCLRKSGAFPYWVMILVQEMFLCVFVKLQPTR